MVVNVGRQLVALIRTLKTVGGVGTRGTGKWYLALVA
jgi:hypothetical protein